MYLKVALLLIAHASLTAGWVYEQEPLCKQQNCPSHMPCRVVAKCPSQESCRLEARCFNQSDLPLFGHDVCKIGKPILVRREGEWGDSYCGPSLPCPNSTYCNSDLQDTYATCCRSAPADFVKPGECPAVGDFSLDDLLWCYNGCNTDGDCRDDGKCCQRGCSKVCIEPVFSRNLCDGVKCPYNMFCRMPESSACVYEPDARCYVVGECMPCELRCYDICIYGFKDYATDCGKCDCTKYKQNY